MRLYELAHDYQRLLDLAGEAGEENAVAFEDTLKGIKGQLDEKVDRCACVIRSMELHEDEIGIEIARLKERRDRVEAARERLKSYVKFELENVGIEKIQGARFYVSVRTNPWKLVIENEEAIPDEFWKPSDPTLDKRAALDALKAGKEVPGATKIQEKSLRVQ